MPTHRFTPSGPGRPPIGRAEGGHCSALYAHAEESATDGWIPTVCAMLHELHLE